MGYSLADEQEKAIELVDKKDEIFHKRIWEIDFLRGLIILGMIFEHFISNFCNIFDMIFDFSNSPFQASLINLINFSNAYMASYARQSVRLVGIFLLFVLTGISSHFSKNNYKRSFILIGIGFIFSLFLFIFSTITGNTQYAIFPIIMCIGVSILLYNVVRSLYLFIIKKINKIDKRIDYHFSWKWVSLVIGLVLLVVTGFVKFGAYFANVPNASINDAMSHFWVLFNEYYPQAINNTDLEMNFVNVLRVIIGEVPYGCDVLGLLPGIGYVFIGGFLGEWIYLNRHSFFRFFYLRKWKGVSENIVFRKADGLNYKLNKRTNCVNILGRNSIWIFFFHQPVLIVSVGLILLIMGARFK